jgi:hypothetical protein
LLGVVGVIPAGLAAILFIPGEVGRIAASLIWLFLMPAMGLVARDGWKIARRLRRDLARNEVERFKGAAGVVDYPDPVFEQMVKATGVEIDGKTEHEVELLAESGLLFRLDSREIPGLLQPNIASVARQSAQAARQHEWVHRQRTHATTDAAYRHDRGDHEVIEKRRTLDTDELTELRLHAERLWKTPVAVLGLVAYVGMGTLMWRAGGGDWFGRFGVVFAMASALATLHVMWFLRRVRMAVRLRRDLESAEVVVFHVTNEDDDGYDTTEVLPHSGRVWAVNDVPSEWRTGVEP